jgi:hypothetical protein
VISFERQTFEQFEFPKLIRGVSEVSKEMRSGENFGQIV